MRVIGMVGWITPSSNTATSLASGRKQRIAMPSEPDRETGWGPRIESGSQWLPWTNCSTCSNKRLMRLSLFLPYAYGTERRAIMKEENVLVVSRVIDGSGRQLVRVSLCSDASLRIMGPILLSGRRVVGVCDV